MNDYPIPCFAAYSLLRLGTHPEGKILFPGLSELPKEGTAGYVRSCMRAKLATEVIQGHRADGDSLPWRDYRKDKVLTTVTKLLHPTDGPSGQILISARNTLNEYGYQVRLNGRWSRRLGDSPIPNRWPVIACQAKKLNLLPLRHVESSTADLISGIPLVIESKAMMRTFFLANCSDLAHVYEVDPMGRLGPSKDPDPLQRSSENQALWQELSEIWQKNKDCNLGETALAQRIEAVASSKNTKPSRHLLHSLLAINQDDEILVFAITGSLDVIATRLVKHWQVRNALLLDNGGSVGWWSRIPGSSEANLLVAGPNYRPDGMVFLDLRVQDFVRPCAHPALNLDLS